MRIATNTILSHQQICHKIKRMAFQVYESNVGEKEVVIAGILENGFVLAKKLKAEIEKIAPLRVVLCEVSMDKLAPIGTIACSLEVSKIQDKSLILVDDVLNSGTTLIYGVQFFLNIPLKQFKTAVLVDRNHKKYPVKADFKGISLSTSLNENVVVSFAKNNYSVFLQ
ncbi:MAG TPA: phosphoribosyltransferase family protein [Flavobacteriaceae bacterium]|nr:phosphoribosyltransferase [Flavobacteriaceae bacterium]HPF12401.1 phosphoribosyltransferase family protein [Flavobacteriaceae bacterium]HQU21585.1 phosphoribosyltransferase family protein [Flavobacteriaceae bacterium]HQU66398.1 phosphoribosyltransferase family protein [Flavobacteriaceae bacterium]HRW45764.1 phosphoribosyltransferase family protein [Flavobacteriaceae bacterium]